MRISWCGLFLAWVMVGMCQMASAQPQLELGNVTGSPGRSVLVPLELSGGTSHAGLYATVELPQGVILEGLSRGGLLNPVFFLEHNASNRRIVTYSGRDQFAGTSGTLLYLRLRIPAGYPEGAYPVRLSSAGAGVVLADADGMGSKRVNVLQAGTLYVVDQFAPEVTVAISGQGQAFLDREEYEIGDRAVVTAVPETGWLFVNWTEAGRVLSVEHSYSFVVDGDRALQANFVPEQPGRWLVSIAAAPSHAGIVSGPVGAGMTQGGQFYGFFEPGTQVTLTAEALFPWTFLDWFEAQQPVGGGASVYQFSVTGHHYLTARMNPDRIFHDRFGVGP